MSDMGITQDETNCKEAVFHNFAFALSHMIFLYYCSLLSVFSFVF